MPYNKLIAIVFLIAESFLIAQARGQTMIERVNSIKKSTFRILVNGQPRGTGFTISKEGEIVTCFHVIQDIQAAGEGKTQVTYTKQIEVELGDGTKFPATIDQRCQNAGFVDSVSRDMVVLVIKPSVPLEPLRLGKFDDAKEGSQIYSCGFPFGLDKPFVSNGMLSTKLKQPGYLGTGGERDAALLDMTINKGVSGGPILLVGDQPEDDRVIGIANFTISPFAPPLQELINTAKNFPGNVHIMGVDFKQFSLQVGNAFENTSVGIGGCISIDYLKEKIK